MSDVKTELELNKEESVIPKENTETVSKSNEGILSWIKVHKKQLIFAGVSITTIVGIILGIRNKDALAELWTSLAEKVKKAPVSTTSTISETQTSASVSNVPLPIRNYASPKEAFDVRRHIRTLGVGKHHSAEKAAEAAALGIDLLPNQTLVSPYMKGAA